MHSLLLFGRQGYPSLLQHVCQLTAPVRPVLPYTARTPYSCSPFASIEIVFISIRLRELPVSTCSFSLIPCVASGYRSRDLSPRRADNTFSGVHFRLSDFQMRCSPRWNLSESFFLCFHRNPLVSCTLFLVSRAPDAIDVLNHFRNAMLTTHPATSFWLPGTKITTVLF